MSASTPGARLHPDSPALATSRSARRYVWLRSVDGHPRRFLDIVDELGWTWERWAEHPEAQVVDAERCIARWRYTLNGGRVSRIDHAATPGLWAPHLLRDNDVSWGAEAANVKGR